MRLSQEMERRSSNAHTVLELFRLHPLKWIGWQELAHAGGSCAWRTRVSDARKAVKKAREGDIEWNKRPRQSAYRYVPYIRLGRDASQPEQQKGLF